MSMKNLRKWYRDKYYGPNCGYNHRKYMYITTKACWFTSTHQKLDSKVQRGIFDQL